MKSTLRIFLISFLATISLIICGCGDPPHEHHNHDDDVHGIVDAGHKLVSFRVPQIPCDACKAKVEGVLKGNDGIVRHSVFKASERPQNVVVVYDPAKTDLDKIKKLIADLGKTVENVMEN